MRERLSALASDMRRSFERQRERAAAARSSRSGLVATVARTPVPSPVAAVDGGLLYQRMHGADIVLARAVGVAFEYSGSRLSRCSYTPSRSPEAEIFVMNSLEEHEAAIFRSLIRLRQELSCAASTLEARTPKLLLLDGSLLPLPSDRPAEGTALRPLYDEVISLYGKLYASCESGGCMLCGVIKDSRSKRLAEECGEGCTDTLFCGHLLGEGERTADAPYFEGKPPAGDLAELGRRVRVFYIKPSRSDLPLRVELLGGGVDAAASAILGLSAISENFAYPAVLVEADMRAALDPKELEPIESALQSLTGMRPLRRNSRPFR